MDQEDPADPSVHEPRVTGAPETIWLVYGDIDHDETHANCCASGEVTWCEDAQFSADVRYLRADLLYHEAQVIAAQRDSLRDALRKVLDSHDRYAKATMSYQNARENFSDSSDERKAHERALFAASDAEREARTLLLMLKA